MSERKYFLNIFKKFASEFPTKIAFRYSEEYSISYLEYYEAMKELSDFFKLYQFPSGTRIGIIGLSNFKFYPYSTAILDEYMLIMLDELDFTNSQKMAEFDLDYILTDESNICVIEYAKSCNTAFILSGESLSLSGVSKKDHSTTNDVFGLILSSGTTSEPKLIMQTYDNLLATIDQHSKMYGYDETSYYLHVAPLNRLPSLKYALYVLCKGGTVHVYNLNFKQILKTLETEKVTVLKMIPSILEKFISYIKDSGESRIIHSLKYITTGGSRIADSIHDDIKEFFNVELVHTYGSNETGNIASTYNVNKGFKIGSVGQIRFHQFKFIDSVLYVKGPTVFKGYLNKNNEDYFVDGWFCTGDVGYLDEDGYLFITGREKELINRGGEKVSPYVLEDAISKLDLFKEVVVFPFDNGVVEEVCVAAVEGKNHIEISELRSKLSQQFSTFKLPTKLLILKEIPKNENGKISRRNLQYSLFQELKTLQNETIIQNLDDIEKRVISCWQKVLKRKDLNLNSNFMEQGGDSLKAAELFSLIEKEFGIELTILDFLRLETVIEMAEFIKRTSTIKKYQFIETLKQGKDVLEQKSTHYDKKLDMIPKSYKNEKYKYLVLLKKGNPDLEPLIFFHPPSGSAVAYQHIAKQLKTSRSIYAITFNYKESNWKYPFTNITVLKDYVDEIKHLQTSGPYFFAGSSMGGRLALEAANVLSNEGKEIGYVFLMDTIFSPKKRKRVELIKIMLSKQLFDMNEYGFAFSRLVARKLNTFISYMIARKSLFKKVSYHLENRILDKNYVPTLNEMNYLTSTTLRFPLQDFYHLNCVYLFAKKSKNTESIEIIKSKVDHFYLETVDCYHGQFVDTHAKETSHILDEYLERRI